MNETGSISFNQSFALSKLFSGFNPFTLLIHQFKKSKCFDHILDKALEHCGTKFVPFTKMIKIFQTALR